jgi:WASH complex subunit strumpellin
LFGAKQALQDTDEEFSENHLEILGRFYRAFESVLKFIDDLHKVLEDLEEGIFIQQTMDSVMHDQDGKQLMAESLYLYGVMLLVIDRRFPGIVRERMLVSYYRYSNTEEEQSNIDEVCQLFRSTGYSSAAGAKRPPKYPENYFARKAVPAAFLRMLIAKLSSDDIYNQTREYPDPEHRSVALANQMSMLYVLLYFAPKVLRDETAKMREIVDKHLPDNWIISVYMGIVVDLVEAWEPYKAARSALNNTLETRTVVSQAQHHIERVPRIDRQLADLLKEGVLNQEYVLDNVPRLLHTMREANVTIRWLMLHTYRTPGMDAHKKSKAIREAVRSQPGFDSGMLFSLLLNTSSFEFVMKEMFAVMLQGKSAKWEKLKHDGSDRMQELSDVFSR